MSGGRATIGLYTGNARAAQVGDIGAITEVGAQFTDRFVIECKHYKDLGIKNLFYEKPCNIRKFWEEVTEEADAHKKLPILIARENHMPTIMCVPMGLIKPVYFRPTASLYFINRLTMNLDVFDYDKVLKQVDGHSLINAANSYDRFAFDRPG